MTFLWDEGQYEPVFGKLFENVLEIIIWTNLKVNLENMISVEEALYKV